MVAVLNRPGDPGQNGPVLVILDMPGDPVLQVPVVSRFELPAARWALPCHIRHTISIPLGCLYESPSTILVDNARDTGINCLWGYAVTNTETTKVQLKSLKQVDMAQRRHRRVLVRQSVLDALPETYRDILTIKRYIETHGTVPFTGGVEIDLTKYVQLAHVKMKTKKGRWGKTVNREVFRARPDGILKEWMYPVRSVLVRLRTILEQERKKGLVEIRKRGAVVEIWNTGKKS